MKSDLPAAALRLMASCPVRTHEQVVPVRSKVGLKPGQAPAHKQARNRSRPAARPGAGRGGANARAIFVAGTRYPSIKAAAAALKMGNTRLYMWLDSGRARFAGEHE